MSFFKRFEIEGRRARLYGMVDAVEPMSGGWISVQIDAVRVDDYENSGGKHQALEEPSFAISRIVSRHGRLCDLMNEPDRPIAPGDWVEFELEDDADGPRAWMVAVESDTFTRPRATRLGSLTRLLSFGPEPDPGPQPRSMGAAAVPTLAANRAKGASLKRAHDLRSLKAPSVDDALRISLQEFASAGFHTTAISVIVQDVGQGSYNEICFDGKPTILFDVGHPIWINILSTPKGFSPDLSAVRLVAISHWDLDHYAFGRTNRGLHEKPWIAPAQIVGPGAFKFATTLHSAGKLALTAAPKTVIWHLPLTLWQCTGVDLNGSGLAMTVQSGGKDILIAGDADLHLIPCTGSMTFDRLVVPHHGAELKPPAGVCAPKNGHGTAAISAGKPNRYNHAHPGHVAALTTADWHVRTTYSDGGLPRGPIHL